LNKSNYFVLVYPFDTNFKKMKKKDFENFQKTKISKEELFKLFKDINSSTANKVLERLKKEL